MYVPYNPNPQGSDVGDCVIRAISKLLGYDWERTYIELAVFGFMVGDMPSANHVWGDYLRGKGFVRDVIPNTCPDCYTVRDFCIDNPYGAFLLATGSHAIAVVDGDYFDSWDSGNESPIFYYRKGYY